MPPFKNILDEKDTMTVIAFFQNKWRKEIYDAWIKRGGLR